MFCECCGECIPQQNVSWHVRDGDIIEEEGMMMLFREQKGQ
jgi:hypothetical protein